MTEEIIIDGVNVAECSHLDGLYCNLGIICNGSHCDYKQLQRLKQENDNLKCLLVDISDIATVNAITTCWTVMDNCDNCPEVAECGTQSPLMKLEIIRKRIHEVLVNENN